MPRLIVAAVLSVLAPPLAADIVLASRTIRPREVIAPGDLVVRQGSLPGVLGAAGAAIGLEARVVLYAGRPVRAADLGPPALVERNQIVALRYARGGLTIFAEGRALDRAAPGEVIRVMNVTSRTTVTGKVRSDGSVDVGY